MTSPDTADETLLIDDGELVLLRTGGGRLLRRARADTVAARRLLQAEYAWRGRLQAAWAAVPTILELDAPWPQLHLHDPGGEPLACLLGRPWPLDRFLAVAEAMARALGRLHAAGLVHRDLHPARLLVQPEAGQAWLSGFGHAAEAARPDGDAGEEARARLTHAAPELSGRSHRPADARSDLYALGVVLFEMLTARLPFPGHDPIALIQAHAAAPAPLAAACVAGVPAQLDAILQKLLAKSPAERYQTAAALAADLLRCRTEWRQSGQVTPFPPGRSDLLAQLRMPDRLYGREADLQAACALVARAAAGGSALLVLTGPAGSGKSSLVEALQQRLPDAGFAVGKADQFQPPLPYGALSQVLRSLARRVLRMEPQEQARWGQRLREALGPQGEALRPLVPELAAWLPAAEAEAPLSAQDLELRFQLAVCRFLAVFARAGRPLVLFFDDLQWCDGATLQLVLHLHREARLPHLLVILACRDTGAATPHALADLLAALRAVPDSSFWTLGPLGTPDMTSLVADTLHCSEQEALPLAELVQAASAGNPLFAAQLLGSLADDGLLRTDHATGRWHWRMDDLHGRQHRGDLVHLLVDKVGRLDAATSEVLAPLSCLGRAPASVLAAVCALDEAALHQALQPSVDAGLVLRLEDGYGFAHDRVQEAAHARLAEADRVAWHLRLGRVLARRLAADDAGSATFEAVQQLNLGAAAITEPEHLEALARLNLSAAHAARAATAYRAAADFAASGLAHLPHAGGRDRLARDLRLMQAHAEFLAGHPARAEPLLLALIRDAPDAVAHAAATRVLMSLQVMASRYADAVQAALACLGRFGLAMPPHPTREAVQQAYDDVQARLTARPLEALLDLPACSDREVEAVMGVLAELFAPACFTDERLALLHLCAMVDLSLLHGLTPSTPHGLAWFGVMSGRMFCRYQEGLSLARLSLRLTERPGLRSARARALFSLEIASVWAAPLSEAVAHGRAAVAAAAQTGELAVACYARHHVVNDRLVAGDALDEVAREIEDSLPPVRQARYDDVIDELLSQQRFVAALQGRTAALHRLDGGDFDSAAFEARLTPDRMPTMIFWHRVLQAQLAFIAGRPREAQAALDAAAPLLWSAVHLQIVNFHLFSVLCWAALAQRLPGPRRQERRQQVQGLLQGLQAWRDSFPEGFADFAALAEAQWTWAEAGSLQALPQHEQAVALAQASGRTWLQALASELAARCHEEAGLHTGARAHWRAARSAWLRWGAVAKLRQLDGQQPWLAEEAGPPAAGPPLVQVNLALVAQVSQTITGEMDGSRLVHTLMATALELGDADKGLLLMPDGQQQLLRAVAVRTAQGIEVQPCARPVEPDDLPLDMLARALQQSRIVSLEEMPAAAAATGPVQRAGAALCLPLLRQGRLSGVLYLERLRAAAGFGGFSREGAALLALLASQGAVALDNARLYRDLTHEIRERRQAEHEAEQSRAALQESENRFRRMADATPDVIWITDIHPERVLYANPSFERIWGRPVDALYQDPRLWTDCIHPDDRERINTEFGRWLNSTAAHGWDVDYRIVRPDGTLRWIHERGFFVVDDEGRPHRVSGISSDVTAARLAAAALRESEERFALAVAGSNDGIWDWDLASDRMFLSERAQRLYGLSPGMDTRPRSEWVAMVRLHPDDSPPQQAMLKDYLEQRLPHYDFEGRVLHAGDGYRWVRIRGLCIRDDAGRAMRMAGSVSDIDSMRRAEAALRQAQRLEAVGTLAGGVAHDFNNILGAILGFGEMALRNTRAGSRQRRDLECIVSAGERGRALVERILAFSRSSVGERVPVHVEAVVKEALALLDAMRPAFVVTDVRLAAGRAAMIGDATQVHQLVSNLVTNALHAMPSGGRLTVTLKAQALQEPVQTTTGPLPAGDYLVLLVSDTGSGIEPEILDRIFDPFFTTKEVGTGTGLGLSLVHGIVTDLGGAVDVATAVGCGSCFTVYLPRSGEAPVQPARELPSLQRGRLEQVMVVDDEEMLVRLGCELLSGLGYVPVGFTSGQEALTAFRAHPERFDAVLTDARMPRMSGLELIDAVRALRPALPVLLVSGFLGAHAAQRARKAGASALLAKPLSQRELAAALATALAPRRAD